jgi:hypothetical protein
MSHSPQNTNAAFLKGLLPEYLEHIGHKPILQPGGLKLKVRCPLFGHHDRNPSFAAEKKGDVWVWRCYPCDVGGTVLELHAILSKLDTKTQFPRICQEVAEIVRDAPANAPMTDQPIALPTRMNTPPIPSDELEALTLPWRRTLFEDAAHRENFASELSLPAYTLQCISNLGPEGLGIAPAGHKWTTAEGKECRLNEPRLVYIGTGYYKIRYAFGDRGGRFLTVGQPERPWLGQFLVPGDQTVKHVHLHESESSALALIAAGYWSSDNSSIVVATSGCCGFKPEWVPLFAGRTVHMWPDADADETGQKFAENTAGLLHGTASKVLFHDWNHTTEP